MKSKLFALFFTATTALKYVLANRYQNLNETKSLENGALWSNQG